MGEIFHNIGILAHVDSGKTTLTEQLLFHTGAIRSAGSVDAGTAATDSLSVEKQRGISVRTATATTKWKDTTINIIDTPGHIDFAGEVERALTALDYAVVIISAVEGMRAHTENILNLLDKAKLPRVIFINKADRSGSDISRVTDEIKNISSVPLFVMTSISDEGSDKCQVKSLTEEEFRTRATEILSDISDEAAEVYLEDRILEKDKAEEILREQIAECRLTPIASGSAKHSVGIKELIDILVKFMPDSSRRATDTLSGIIFKIEHDKSAGKISHVRLFGGEIENRNEIELIAPENNHIIVSDSVDPDNNRCIKEKVTQIKKFCGAKGSDTGLVKSGDVAAIYGLSSAKNGFYIGSSIKSENFSLVNPFLRVKVTPADSDPLKLPSLAAALSELSDEEPYIDAKWSNGQKEITISTTGKIQLEVLSNLLKERYNLSALFSPPTVIYKETPLTSGIGHASYTMPKPCWAVVEFRIEPMPRGYGVSYHGKLPNNQCFYRYQSHIRTSFTRCLEQGLYGWEVTDFKCTLIGGEHHTIHTHPLDFFVCTPMAFMNGLSSVGTTILEPLLIIRITAPEEYSGKIFSEIIKMGGKFDSPVSRSGNINIEAIVPVSTSMSFPEKLASITSGKAVLSQNFYDYRECKDAYEHINPRNGVNPLDRSKWILYARGAYNAE